jgi:molybdate transport system regulatory protein
VNAEHSSIAILETAYLKTHIRLFKGDAIAMGPGKAALLMAIAQTGSISAAGRKMKMSYRRAWLLVDTMNQCFNEPLVISSKGGKDGGGAHLSLLGETVLAMYLDMTTQVETVVAQYQNALSGLCSSSVEPLNHTRASI